jgi:hypothetical protein
MLMAVLSLPILSDASHDNDKSHFDGHFMNHHGDNNIWIGNSGHAFGHSFLEGENHSWGFGAWGWRSF